MSDPCLPDLLALRREAELAGLAFDTVPLARMQWRVPGGARLTGGRLRWDRLPFGGEAAKRITAPRDLLLKFAGLATKDDSAYRRFASTYGPLWICSHGLPATHVPEELAWLDRAVPQCPSVRFEPASESSHAWRAYAEEAAAIVRITSRVRTGEPAPRELWLRWRLQPDDEPLEANIEFESTHASPSSGSVRARVLDSQADALEGWVNWWLESAAIRPVASLREGLDLAGPDGLFSALAFQMATLLTSETHIAQCAACGRFFRAPRKPQTGRRSFCQTKACRERGRRRLSAQRPR